MAAVEVTRVWTAFLSLLTALLAALGFRHGTTTATAVPAARPEQPAAPAPAPAPVPVPRKASVRDRSLPPTIKQRIRAEAHGSSPSVRHLPSAAAAEPAPTELPDLALAA
ncbi:DUF6344 domain-containing protein, partial [Streptomyces sp. NRRL S-118]|uniref:DUF6344 domain-containing protein n=1 Tax=Streptomyces sp. NRRL S-118 TaxID=1463881 RepID=UPI0004CB4F81